MAKLGEVCTIVSGSTPKTSVTSYWDGNIKWITPAELNEDTFYIMDSVRHITEEGKEKTGLSYLPTGTVILSSRAPIGKTAIAGCKMCCNQGFKNLICSDAIYNEYLYFFLKSKTDYLNSLGRGATFKEISKSIVESIEIPLPEVNQQKEIAEKFKKLEQLISLRKQQLAKLDELVKARFVEMFGTFPANPFRWDTGKIQDVVSDVRYGSSRPAVEGGKYPYLRMNNITYSGELDLRDTKRIDIPDSELDKCTVRRGDVLFNRTNSKELVGKTCVYNRDELMVLAGFVIRVRINERIRPEVLSAFLNMDFSKRMLIGICKTAIGQANINAKELQNIDLYIPPIELQDQFVTLKNKIDQQKQTVQQSLEKLELMKKALLQEYFG